MSSRWSALGRRAADDEVGRRLVGLATAVEAAQGRVDVELLERVSAVVDRAADRLRLSADHTVVALAGATGSGKSSLFNQLCGLDLAAIGVKRPTTSWALACSWGDGAEGLLEWLGVPPRHQVNRASSLDDGEPQEDLQGLVLLDLPDHDSTEVSHHLEVERLVRLADVLVWVLDPQKYADAAIHDRFLRPLASARDVMLVVFNHVDELAEEAVAPTVADVSRLLLEDGLEGVPVIATSAKRGEGLDELRAAIVFRVSEKRAARSRLATDIRGAAQTLRDATGAAEPALAGDEVRSRLVTACAEAAGVPSVVGAVERSQRAKANQHLGWPPAGWVSRLRREPLDEVGLASATGSAGHGDPKVLVDVKVQRAQLGQAVRLAAEASTAGLAPAWQKSARAASTARVGDIAAALGRAVTSTDLGISRPPWWWRAMRVVQWVLLGAAVVGAGWLLILAVIGVLGQSQPDTPRLWSVPLSTSLLLGGLALGALATVLGRWAGRRSARNRAQRAEHRLHAAVAGVVEELVIAPMQTELDAYRACREGIATALG